jgi:hypothetical protein
VSRPQPTLVPISTAAVQAERAFLEQSPRRP